MKINNKNIEFWTFEILFAESSITNAMSITIWHLILASQTKKLNAKKKKIIEKQKKFLFSGFSWFISV